MTIEVGHEGTNRRTQSTMESKKTSTRGAGKGQKLSSGTEEELIEDLQRVHKLFPNAEPDKDLYRAHGIYADAAWKEHFSRFNRFVGEAGLLLPPFRQAMFWLYRVTEEFQQHGKEYSKQDRERIRVPLLKIAELTKTDRVPETLTKMEEEEKAERVKRTLDELREEFGINGVEE